jgi:hypothetical protein
MRRSPREREPVAQVHRQRRVVVGTYRFVNHAKLLKLLAQCRLLSVPG